jgi:hypothetical protein
MRAPGRVQRVRVSREGLISHSVNRRSSACVNPARHGVAAQGLRFILVRRIDTVAGGFDS